MSEHKPLRVLLYSDDASVRQTVETALGTRPHPDLPPIEFVACATEPVVWQHLDTGSIDIAILDGEAAPAGGIGIARQMKDELFHAPPAIVLTARAQDAWLATWSRADGVSSHPIDPLEFASTFVEVARSVVPTTA